jgi:hypothetical protein
VTQDTVLHISMRNRLQKIDISRICGESSCFRDECTKNRAEFPFWEKTITVIDFEVQLREKTRVEWRGDDGAALLLGLQRTCQDEFASLEFGVPSELWRLYINCFES